MKRLITKADRLAARYRPTACTETIKHAQGTIYHSPDKLHAIAYRGTAGRAAWHYTFKTAEQCDRQIADFLARLEEVAKWRSEKAAATRAARTNNITEIWDRARQTGRISAAETAALIRHRLRLEFPGVAFRVRTEDHGTINAHWTDGPSSRAVSAILNAYQFGGFDGMIDMAYSVHRWLYPDGTMSLAHCHGTEGSKGSVSESIGSPLRGGAVLVTSGPRYVFGHRAASFQATLAAARAYCDKHGLELPAHVTTDETSLWRHLNTTRHHDEWLSVQIHRAREAATL